MTFPSAPLQSSGEVRKISSSRASASRDPAACGLVAHERGGRRRGPHRGAGPQARLGGSLSAQPARHPTARARKPAADRLAIVRDQLRERAERHLSDVVQRQQIARFVVEVVQRAAKQGQPDPEVGLVGGLGARVGALRDVAPEHLQPVPGPAPVAGGDAATDLAQPQIHPLDPGQHVPLPVHDEEDLLTEIGQIGVAHAQPGELAAYVRSKARVGRSRRHW